MLPTPLHLFDFPGSSDGLVAIYDTKNSSGSPRHVSEVVGITSNSGGLSRASTSVVQWYPSDNAVFVSSGADGQLKVWDANHLNQPVESFALSKRIYCHNIARLNPSQVSTFIKRSVVISAERAAILPLWFLD